MYTLARYMPCNWSDWLLSLISPKRVQARIIFQPKVRTESVRVVLKEIGHPISK